MLDKFKKWLSGPAAAPAGTGLERIKPAEVPTFDSELPVEEFDAIRASGAVWVQWEPGASRARSQCAQSDVESGRFECRVVDRVLVVSLASGSAGPARVAAQSTMLRRFECDGPASGSAHGIAAELFEAAVCDGPRLLVSGKTSAAKFRVRGAGRLEADGLRADAVQGVVEGSGSLEAWAGSMAEIDIGGGGEAVVYGNPALNTVRRNGDGRAKIGHRLEAVAPENEDGIFGQLPIPRK